MSSIDFDAASAAWMANKIRKGPMLYYTCEVTQKNGKMCPHAAIQEPGSPAHRCKRHLKSPEHMTRRAEKIK
jgi:hypothetical protein